MAAGLISITTCGVKLVISRMNRNFGSDIGFPNYGFGNNRRSEGGQTVTDQSLRSIFYTLFLSRIQLETSLPDVVFREYSSWSFLVEITITEDLFEDKVELTTDCLILSLLLFIQENVRTATDHLSGAFKPRLVFFSHNILSLLSNAHSLHFLTDAFWLKIAECIL